MKKLIIALFLLIFVVSSCAKKQPEKKAVCWRSIVSIDFPFVISMINICDGSEGGELKYYVVEPILDFINERIKKVDQIREEDRKTRINKNIF